MRPTIALCLIIKNEIKNLPRIIGSVAGCFDEIHITDTGSNDGSVQWIEQNGALMAKCPVFVHTFSWINDFAAARNYSFLPAKTDYLMWMDADDVMSSKDAFIQWRDYAMEFAECWLNTYNYALDPQGKPIISFMRERVFKRSIGPEWKYRLHEGILMKPEWTKDYAVSWSVNHLRDAQDIAQDKSRNITILEEVKAKEGLDSRLKFYYGKELYEVGQPPKALLAFEDALATTDLEHHDRVLSLQYAAYSAMASSDQLKDEYQKERFELLMKALSFAHKGMEMEPNRAEFHVIAGDVHLKCGQVVKSIPYYSAAKKCLNPKSSGSPYEGALYSFTDCYGENPTLQLAKIYFNLGNLKAARREALEAKFKFKSVEAEQILKELTRVSALTKIDNNQVEVDEIVFTTMPHTAYPFDEELYKTKAMGGSESSLILMAKALQELGHKVIVFNMRDEDLVAESGVEYKSNKDLNLYMSKFKPKLHIAWRHNIKLTNAKTYLWCHDLTTPTVETVQNFEKILCLTPFHKNYVMAKQGLSADKITVTRNGLVVDKLKAAVRKPKNPNKLVWMSSLDRGLDRCIPMLDIVREEFPEIELHIYYGIESLYKYGLGPLADHLKSLFATRPWIKYHGFTEQAQMFSEVSDAVVWPHTASFIETFCLTALEMLELKIFPVTRSLGALTDTLAEAEEKEDAILLEFACNTEKETELWAKAVIEVLRNKDWERMSDFDLEHHNWKTVAKEWLEFMQ